MTAIVHLLRHADHGHVGKILTGRLPDVHLSAIGRAQAEVLGERMAAVGLDGLYSSPQPRALETAQAIADATGLAVRVAPAFDEIDFGSWTGQTFKALDRDPRWRVWNARRDSARTPGGETMADVATRATGLLETLAGQMPGASIGVVSHSDVIKACICRYLDLPFQHIHLFDIDPVSITSLLVEADGGTVLTLNEPGCAEPEEAIH